MSSHSPLRRTSVRSGSSTLNAWSWKVLRVAVDLLGLEHRAQRGLPGRVADPRGEVADDQDDRVPGVLELAQLLQHDHVAEVDVGRRRVDAELHPQRPALARRPRSSLRSSSPPAANRPRCAPGMRRSSSGSEVGCGHRRPMLDSRLRSGWPIVASAPRRRPIAASRRRAAASDLPDGHGRLHGQCLPMADDQRRRPATAEPRGVARRGAPRRRGRRRAADRPQLNKLRLGADAARPAACSRWSRRSSG